MKITTWSFYDKDTGQFKPLHCGSYGVLDIENSTPTGCAAIEGKFDHLSQRIDIETGKVIDYQPPKPSADHEWNADIKRWQLTEEAATRDRADMQARAEIERLEQSQLRSMRELIIDPENKEAISRLDEIDARINTLRANLKR